MSTDSITTPDAPGIDGPQDGADETPQWDDYWGVNETFRFDLPDGKQYFEVKPMDEGMKTRFQKMTNKGIRMNQRSQEAHLDIDPADERHTLILESVVGWFIMKKDPKTGEWREVPCSTEESTRKRTIRTQFLEGANGQPAFNPKIIQDLEFFIRTQNPWMQADMDLEELYKERDRIELLIKQNKEQEAGELASASK